MSKQLVRIRIIDARQSRASGTPTALFRAFMLFLFLFGPGVWFNSVALQWTAFLVVAFGFFCTVVVTNTGVTIDEARTVLDSIEKDAKFK